MTGWDPKKVGGGILGDEVLAVAGELGPHPPATHFFVEGGVGGGWCLTQCAGPTPDHGLKGQGCRR